MPSYPSKNRDANERAADAFGKRMAARLNAGLDEVHPDISERLRFARVQAMKTHAALVRVVPVQNAVAQDYALAGNPGGSGKGPGGNRAAMVGLIIAMVFSFGAALVGIEHQTQMESVREKAEVDMALLLDELPPAAYMDAGFIQYLRTEGRK